MRRPLAIILLFLSLHVTGEKPMQIDRERWMEMTEDINYRESYEDREFKNPDKPTIHKPGNYQGVKYVLYALVVAAVLFLLYRIITNYRKNLKVVPDLEVRVMTVEEAEEHLHEADLDSMLTEALAAGNFKMALRIQFLMLIKTLSEKGHIIWAAEKTNWQYHSELKDKLLADQFREAVISFERSWYGNYDTKDKDYEDHLIRCLLVHEKIKN